MKTQLIFFDSFKNSIKGTTRGLIAFISLIIFDLIRFFISNNVNKNSNINNNVPNNIYAIGLVYLLLCSAIGVQLPSKYSEAIVYGLLVGLVVYGVLNLYNLAFDNDPVPKEDTYKSVNIIINILLGTISCGIASSIVYLLVQ